MDTSMYTIYSEVGILFDLRKKNPRDCYEGEKQPRKPCSQRKALYSCRLVSTSTHYTFIEVGAVERVVNGMTKTLSRLMYRY